MELLIVMAFLVGLAVAAPRWGSDSRLCAPSKERDQARLGLVWQHR
jgi:hypothetical protein